MTHQPAAALLAELHAMGIRLWAEDGRLRINAPKGALTNSIKARLTEQKPALLDLLQQAAATPDAKPAITRQTRPDRMPLSFAQQRLWFLSQFKQRATAYNMPMVLPLEGTPDRDALQQAFSEIIRRHEILRTRFPSADGEPYQHIDPPSTPPLPLIDLRDHTADETAVEAQRLIDAETTTPFDLSNGPLLRLSLVRLDATCSYLLITLHHLISDGWSAGVLSRELSSLYDAIVNRRPNTLPELGLQYADFTLWQHAYLNEEKRAFLLEFWQDHLHGAPLQLDLPTDFPRSTEGRPVGKRLPFHFNPALGRALKQAATDAGTTVSIYLQSVFAVLLARLCRSRDLIVGIPIANRNHLELEPLIGFFVNTLAIRHDLSDNPTFRDFLDRVNHQSQAAYSHQDLPFEHLVEALQPNRDGHANPVVQVLFAMQNAPAEPPTLSGLQVGPLQSQTASAKFDLIFEMVPREDGGFNGEVEFNTALFEDASINRFAQWFENLASATLSGPDQRVSHVPLIDSKQRTDLLAGLPEFTTPMPSQPLIHQVVEATVAQYPQAVAATGWDKTETHPWSDQLTFDELNRAANRLARFLRGKGVGPERVVAVFAERSPATLVSLLAVLKAGGVYLPLNPTDPAERIQWMLADASAAWLLVGNTAPPAESIPDGMTIINTTSQREEWASLPDVNLPVPGNPEHAAYLIYTSGSTGKPKGVVVPHRGLCNLAPQQARNFGLNVGDRWLQYASLVFDMSLSEIFMALCSGATLILPPTHRLLPGPDLAQTLRDWAVTHVFLPPSILAAQPYVEIPSLKTLIVGGEACPQHLVETWAPTYTFFNAYGPTEYTVHSTQIQCAVGETVTIGHGIHNTRAMVLDDALEPCPVGVPGELCIAGPGLARGYQGRPDLTADRFVPDPHAETPGGRLYRSGDLVRRDATGRLHFMGRLDDQVKLRGFRIEPSEITTVLLDHPGVTQAITVLRHDGPGDGRLVAYAAGDAGSALTQEALRDHVAQHLPAFMVPSAVVVRDTLPLTTNGKIDRRALPAPEPDRSTGSRQTAKTALETKVAAVWAEVLGLSEVDVTTNFFDLGGHSLLLARTRVLLQDRLQREISMVDMFEYPTVRGLARFLAGEPQQAETPRTNETHPAKDGAVAVIGMAGRFPQSNDLDAFWRNLCDGVDTIETLSVEELHAAGVAPEEIAADNYVPRGGFVAGVDTFDAAFFDIPPWEAETMDPQHRLFLETAWHALENAGYNPADHPGRTGVFSSVGMSEYLFDALLNHPDKEILFTERGALTGNTNDYMPARTSYKLNLTGPSLNVQASCAGSLMAVHAARNHLLQGDCDTALAGGVCLHVPQRTGYRYYENSVYSPDGRTCSFDASGLGTVNTNGVGIVVLKKLDLALADGDHIYAVIRGGAVTNDGADKVGAAAPSLKGLEQAASLALADAGIEPGAVSFVEAHASGTLLGDAVEVTALARAYTDDQREPQQCILGSLKPNFGLMSAASGVAGLIKTTLSLHHEVIPPTIHFEKPNPKIAFEQSPFRIGTQTLPWPRNPTTPRFAGVNSFGRAGTNVHLILQEAPHRDAVPSEGPWLLLLSARSTTALDAAVHELHAFLKVHPNLDLGDVSWTLQTGRRHEQHRSAFLVNDLNEALSALSRQRPLALHPDPTRLGSAAQRWLAGESVDWEPFHDGRRRRVPLPGYPFQRRRFWLERREDKPQPNKKQSEASPLKASYERPDFLGTWEAPKGEIEAVIAEIWQEILGVSRVGRRDHFFELGGHSIFATKVITALRQTLNVTLPLAAVFEHPTPAELADHLAALRKPTASQKTMFPFAGEVVGERHPLSFGQERLLFLHQLMEQHIAYSLPFAAHLKGPLNRDALARALSELADRHDSLRTLFRTEDRRPSAHVQPKGSFTLETATLADLDDDLTLAVDAVLHPHARRPFQLDTEHPFRALLLQLSETHHVLQIVLHHIVADGWSLGNLTRELSTLYAAFAHGTPATLPILALRYGQYAAGERRLLAGEAGQAGLDYWRKRLAGVPTRLDLPTDRPHPGKRTYDGDNYYYNLDNDILIALERMAHQRDTGLFTVIHAAFSALLYRLSGCDDIVVGTPVGNRNHPQTEAMIGLFINTLALRTSIKGKQSFSDLLDKVRHNNLADFDQAHIPFEQVVAATQASRNLAHDPLFQVVLAMQNTPRRQLALEGLQVEDHYTGTGSAMFEITWFFTREATGLVCSVEYNTALYDAATVARWVSHFQTLLRAICADPERRIDHLPLVDDRERTRLLTAWNATDTGFPRDLTTHRAFEHHAADHPDRIALRWNGCSMTYGALNDRANLLAAHLTAQGIGLGDVVAILLAPGFDLIACAIAILKTNACYLPIDLGMPARRLEFMLDDAGAGFLFTSADLAADRAARGIPDHVTVIVPETIQAQGGKVFPNPNLTDSAILPAYMIYTSGSTGRPKGITITHRNLISLMQPAGRGMFAEDEIVMQLSSFSFDLSAWQIWGALLSGARLVLLPPEGLDRLPENIVAEKVTNLVAVSHLMNLLVDQSADALADLRCIGSTGEAASAAHFRAMRQRFPNMDVVNVYGPTECTIIATGFEMGAEVSDPVPIGKPLPERRAYVLDAAMNPTVPGVVGDLYLGGPGVSQGYHRRPALTADKFVPNPFTGPNGEDAGSRLYYTGDVARVLPNGDIEFLGRADHQVKIRGYRVELGDIETTLAESPYCRRVHVGTDTALGGEKQLVAYLERIPNEEADAPATLLRDYLEERLPEYMVPAFFVFLDALPLTTNGKLDRAALPAVHSGATNDTPREAARTPMEKQLASIWAGVLGGEEPGIHDNFFELGGNSINLLRVRGHLEKTLQRKTTMVTLFEHTTIAALAAFLEKDQPKSGAKQEKQQSLDERERRKRAFRANRGRNR